MKALLVIDMVNDFVEPEGALPVPGALDIIPNVQKAIDYFYENGMVFFCNDNHSKDDPEFKEYPEHCVKGTYGSGISSHFKLNFDPITVVEKTTFSAFSNGTLDKLLKMNNIHEVYVCGVATEICIKQTVWSSRDLRYRTFVLTDCIAGLNKGDEGIALMKMGWWDAVPIKSTELIN